MLPAATAQRVARSSAARSITRRTVPTHTTDTPAADADLVAAIRAALAAQANPAKAAAMQAYMKSALPFHGVTHPEITRACRVLFQRHGLDRFEIWRDTILELWRRARVREERYAAMLLADLPRYGDYQDLRTLPLYEELIVSGAWWDYVDLIASHRIGALLRHHPREMKPVLRRWAKSDDIWLRRAAILCQLGFKQQTDLPLLYACIEPSVARPEFFLRKGIGWALREYAKTDAREVSRYVKAERHRLSALSQREALKARRPRPTKAAKSRGRTKP